MGRRPSGQLNRSRKSSIEREIASFNLLRQELLDLCKQDTAIKRPILTHLNADTSWLLSFPYPDQAKISIGRSRFNILIDPWLQGPQSDVATWFSTQWHAIKSSVQTIAQLEIILAEMNTSSQFGNDVRGTEKSVEDTSFIDLIAISHEFTDHCHKETLLEISAKVPVFATIKAAELIRSWKHFDNVIVMPPFSAGTDWRTTSISLLPNWLGVGRLVTRSDSLYYHSAVMIFVKQDLSDNAAETVIYTPHGVEATTFSIMASAKPPVHTLAFLHGLHDISLLTKQLNLGALNALKAQKQLQPKYWIGTHDEVKIGGGFIAPFLRRKAYTIFDALTYGKFSVTENAHAGVNDNAAKEVSYTDLCSGQSLLLA